ncbi:MAG: RedB protein [Polyangiales bacterium]
MEEAIENGVAAPRLSRGLVAILIAAWMLVVCGSFVMLWRYKSTPGAAGAKSDWPHASHLARSEDRATLVLFAHPYCPCTRASLEQLSRIMARVGGRVDAKVLFSEIADEDPKTSELWKKVEAIPGLVPLVDRDGMEAAAFGAKTSGHVVLFDRSGRGLYSGGITSARGHEGDNPGAQRVVALIATGVADRDTAPIFGCALKDD